MAFAGFGLFVLLDLVAVVVVLVVGSELDSAVPAMVGTGVLALAGLGGGGGLLFSRRVRRKGLGIGLIAGWVVLSVATLGFATGLNPALYS
ncbi:hypothetical protein ACIBG7_40925 [Nonomuraea sp. NPDC050328]|uniref:hypothetical protein n=1 Tax=Nonomuraea sp. NPDC050328 TaxID=3364361 RepID=UPI00378A2826